MPQLCGLKDHIRYFQVSYTQMKTQIRLFSLQSALSASEWKQIRYIQTSQLILLQIKLILNQKMKFFSEKHKSQTHDYWVNYAKTRKRLIVFYEQEVLDLTQFARKHPAGERAIQSYYLKDVKDSLFRVYPHPPTILNTLMKYRCGKVQVFKQKQVVNLNSKGICKQTPKMGKKQQNPKRVRFASGKKENNPSNLGGNKKKGQILQEDKSENEQNLFNLQENKPSLHVPFFKANILCFISQKKETK